MNLQAASALVTGAGRGIGRATALTLARAGVRLTLTARTASELESLAEEIRRAGGQAIALPGDLCQRGFAKAAVAKAAEAHGGLQILVNNAGVGHQAKVAETSDQDWDRLLETNLTAVFRLTREALPQLARQGGHIFMISSLAGSNPIPGLAAYCASKAALDHFSRCLMLEVRQQGIKVTTLAPGSVDTGFGAAAGLPREDASWMLKPQDVADTILHLLGTRDEAHLSRVELRPSRPVQRT